MVWVERDNTFGEAQYYGSSYHSTYGGALCKCTVDVTDELPDSVTPVGITVYQHAEHFGSTNWKSTSDDPAHPADVSAVDTWPERRAPGYVHVTFPASAVTPEGESFTETDGSPSYNIYSNSSGYWTAFPETGIGGEYEDAGDFGLPSPFPSRSDLIGEFTLRLSMVNAEVNSSSPTTARDERIKYALTNCDPYSESPSGTPPESAVPPVIFRIDTTIDTSDSKGADPRSNPGTIAFTEVLLQELIPGRTIALAQRGAAGVLGAEALMVEVQSWSQHSWVELRDRSGRVHRLSPSRPRIELPPNTGAIETLTWTYGSETPATPGALGPTLRIRHRGPTTPSPAAAFRLSWRGLLEAANRAVGAPLSIPGFNPLPDWTALTFGLDGLAPGQDNPTLTLNTPLSGALFTLPLTPAPHHTFTWSIQNPYVQITGQLQEQRGPRLGVWVDQARVSSPFGDLTLLPTHVLVEMDHVGQ